LFVGRRHHVREIDWEFIVAEEGDWSIGYRPNVKNPKSGKINSGATIVYWRKLAVACHARS
jgi:hypothetical protein